MIFDTLNPILDSEKTQTVNDESAVVPIEKETLLKDQN